MKEKNYCATTVPVKKPNNDGFIKLKPKPTKQEGKDDRA